MAFTAQDVKKLREMTNVGMMDCKKALQATDGDIDAAIRAIRLIAATMANAAIEGRQGEDNVEAPVEE